MSEALTRSRIEAHVAAFDRLALSREGHRWASVAIAIVSDPEPAFLLTRRPWDAPRHPGQFALPGGRGEAGESAEDTARRELSEELGVHAPAGSMLGLLDDYQTRSGFVITPAVFWIDHCPGVIPDEREVAAVYRVPLAELLSDSVVQQHEGPEPDRPIVSLGIVGTQVFAPTAALLVQFREVALLGRSTRVAHFDQPPFAWA